MDGDQPFLGTATAGLYRALAADSVLEAVPVNPPAAETDLRPASHTDVRQAIPGVASIVDDASSWPRYIFRAGRGPEPWRTLAAVLLALLIAETVVAASRTLRSRRASGGQAP